VNVNIKHKSVCTSLQSFIGTTGLYTYYRQYITIPTPQYYFTKSTANTNSTFTMNRWYTANHRTLFYALIC